MLQDRKITILPLFLIAASAAVLLADLSILRASQPSPRILIFSKTAGFRHDSIPDGINAIRQLGQQNNFDVDATEDSSQLNDTNLARYQTLVFLNTTGDVLDANRQASVQTFIRSGGGFVGVHSATDTEYDWAWYGGLVGAYFQGHPDIQRTSIKVEDSSHPSTSSLPADWQRTDEWYNFRANPRGRVKVLAILDESTYNGGTMGADHPIAWCQFYDGGRAWYTAGGHTKESYAEPLFRQHLLGGIQFAAKIRDGVCSAITAASASDYKPGVVARDSIGAIFGSGFTTRTQPAPASGLPFTLGGVTVKIRNNAGIDTPSRLFFVSPAQINFLAPAGFPEGQFIFTVAREDGTSPSGMVNLVSVSPGIFSANANGRGVPAGVALRVRQNGAQQYEPIARFDQSQNIFVPEPIDMGEANDRVFLVLFGTGFSYRSALSTVKTTIGGAQAQVTFAGAQGMLAGLDQINILLPRDLAGRGEVDVALMIDGAAANIVSVNVK